MSKKKSLSESEFLSIVACPKYFSLKYNPYELDITQSVALKSLKIFYKLFDELKNNLDLDNIINIAVKKSIGKKFKNELDSYKKNVKLYCFTFIYDFIKTFPLETWYSVLVDMKIPLDTFSRTIYLECDFILKNRETEEISVINFLHKMDFQIENNLHYFQSKASFIQNKIYLPLNKPTIKHYCFYLPKYKHSSLKKRDTFLFIPLEINQSHTMDPYVEIFSNKFLLQRNPFCLNYSCKVRKYCYDNT